MRKFIAVFLFILVVPLAFAAIHYERQDFMGDTYFEQQIQAKRGIASSSSVSATTISTENVTSTGTVTAAGVNIGSGGAIEMLKASTLVFPTTTTTTVAVSGVLPGDTVVATPNAATTHALKSASPSTGSLTFVWAGDNATTVTVGVVVLR